MRDRVAEGANTYAGYNALGWEVSVWILHAMYENRSLPDSMSHDDVRRAGVVAGEVEPVVIGSVDLDAPPFISTGVTLGRSEWPGVGWERLRWRDLAHRLGVTMFTDWPYPCFRTFPFTTWPANIRPPAEGSLDREQFTRLLEHLQDQTSSEAGECFALYSPLAVDLVSAALFHGDLPELVDLHDSNDVSRNGGSPTNAWPSDHSWFIYTDWDLWGTKVSGSTELIANLLADSGPRNRDAGRIARDI